MSDIQNLKSLKNYNQKNNHENFVKNSPNKNNSFNTKLMENFLKTSTKMNRNNLDEKEN